MKYRVKFVESGYNHEDYFVIEYLWRLFWFIPIWFDLKEYREFVDENGQEDGYYRLITFRRKQDAENHIAKLKVLEELEK